MRTRDYGHCIVETARKEIGVTEDLGRNRGQRVNEYLCAVNMAPGNPWCAAFVAYVLNRCGVEHTVTAWSPTSTPRHNLVYNRGRMDKHPQPGDVFSLYYQNLGRIGHTGIVEDWGEDYVITIEGNTNGEGSREGDGVWRKKRMKRTIYKVSRWHK